MKLDPTNKTHKLVIFLLIAVPMMVIGSIVITTADNSVEEESKVKQAQTKQVEKVEKETVKNVDPMESELQPPERPPHFSYESDNILSEEEQEEARQAILDRTKVTEETIKESKEVAEKFALEFSNYSAATPEKQIKAVEPYTGYHLRKNWETAPPRYPMTISETKPLSHVTYPVDGGSNYEMAWNVVVEIENTLFTGQKSKSEDWIWLYLSKEEDGWKVQRMDIHNG